MSVEDLLDEVDEMIDKAWNLPLSGGKCVVEAERLRDILDEVRANIPSEVRQAKAIVQDRTEIVSIARKEGEDIIRKAEERAQAMVKQEEIVKQAQQKATEILQQAQQHAREMRKGSSEFAEDVLRRAEENLAERVGEIRQVRQSLRNPQRAAQTDASADHRA